MPPWRLRLIEIKAGAELLPSGGESIGQGFAAELMRLRPVRIASFGPAPRVSGLTVKSRKVTR